MSQISDQIQEQNQKKQQSLLQQALKTCNIDEVKQAIQQERERINEQDDKLGWTVLYKAVVYGDELIVDILLTNGANPNIKNKLQDTPLHLSIENNNFEIFKILLKHKADPNIKGPDGMSPLHTACFSQKDQFILGLLKSGADIDIKTMSGITPLHIVAESNCARIIKILLDRSPQINIKDKEGKTAIDYCTDKNCKEILEEYESNCMNPLNESIISTRTEYMNDTNNINQINHTNNMNKMIQMNNTNNAQTNSSNTQNGINTNNINNKVANRMDTSTASNVSSQYKQINTAELRQNWDLKIQGLKKSIRETKDLKYEVCQTLDDHKAKEEQRNNLLSQMKRQDEMDSELKSQQNKQRLYLPDENDKENCSSIINFIASETDNKNVYNNEKENNQKPFFSSNYQLPSLNESLELRKEIQGATIGHNQRSEHQGERQSEGHTRFSIKESKTISKWLREINLECLMQNFLDNNVYDNQSLLKFLVNSNDWDKLLITLFGVDRYGYRLRIITKIQEDCGMEKRNGIFAIKYNLGGIELPTIEAWLQSLQLEQYIDLFILTGFDDLECMMFQMTTDNPITDDILFKEVGVCDHSARKVILNSLNRDAQNAQMVAVPKNFCGGFNFETSGGINSNSNKCDNKCTIF